MEIPWPKARTSTPETTPIAPYDPELPRQRVRARNLLRRYNAAPYEAAERRATLDEILADVGTGAMV